MNSLNSELTRVGAPANVLRRALITLALLTSATACVVPQAEVEEPGIEAVVVTQWNDSTELFLEYPDGHGRFPADPDGDPHGAVRGGFRCDGSELPA